MSAAVGPGLSSHSSATLGKHRMTKAISTILLHVRKVSAGFGKVSGDLRNVSDEVE